MICMKNYHLGTIIKNTNLKENPFYERELNYIQSKNYRLYM